MKLINFQLIHNRESQVSPPELQPMQSAPRGYQSSSRSAAAIERRAQRHAASKANRNSLAGAIRMGIQLDFSDLDSLACAWRYRGIPVFLFGFVQSPSTQADVFGQIHISPKCPSVANYQGSVWASSDYSAALSAFPQDKLRPCPHCLRHLYSLNIPDLVRKDRFGTVIDIDWLNYARYFANTIFDKSPVLWLNGERPQKVSSVFAVDSSKYTCSICQCQIKASRWALNPELAQRSGLPQKICLLCAERRARAVILATPQAALRAATLRYESLTKQLGSEPQASWMIAEQVLPASWLPLVQRLKTLLGPPKVFQVIAPRVLAILCWPSMGRAIIADNTKESKIPENYSIWRKDQIERELGLG
ncbi:hypothetical protein MO867_18540 [Microbulbifer sp. OS29]|uniref:Uncharacterized protein n=1 Tax=Microbulbifer okhotskensis TaxID=2926617 RepID=A0A9X2EQ06_9GAMM|nr:hypothetical protein [Microbulbifer okhotskensis]MCO1336334.1 hypothetical protein [Microbulbifer okhotskensis]